MRFGFALSMVVFAVFAVSPGLMPVVGTSTAQAQDVSYINTHRDWHAFQTTENGNRVCYIASQPTDEEGDYSQRGDVYVLVTHRPYQDSRNEISFITGYTYQSDSEVTVSVGDETFTLFTHQDTAWAYDAETDTRLVDAMRAGLNMVVRGRSSRGTLTTDTYSLLGFTAALEEIDRACAPT
ncbi:invasion associated locus B family protein [Fodinicurvata sp. EGI_FJ10296]|uniref:invasion associated locus B family protein n=1 Tax=Fodinicurvata sp. EGI_FJ10296 TaxID=3231908 RepID=UPI0034542805